MSKCEIHHDDEDRARTCNATPTFTVLSENGSNRTIELEMCARHATYALTYGEVLEVDGFLTAEIYGDETANPWMASQSLTDRMAFLKQRREWLDKTTDAVVDAFVECAS